MVLCLTRLFTKSFAASKDTVSAPTLTYIHPTANTSDVIFTHVEDDQEIIIAKGTDAFLS